MQLVICNNTKEYFFMGVRETLNVKFHKNCEKKAKARALIRNFLWYYNRQLITSIALEKYKKECDTVKIILVQGFCPLKIKITQFSDGFRLNVYKTGNVPSLLATVLLIQDYADHNPRTYKISMQ